jgi:dolichyl-phosphate-mannose-protein mannosyltransferase
MMAHEATPAAGQQAGRPADRATSAVPPGRWAAPQIPGSRVWGWAGPLLVTALGTWLRFSRLSAPRSIVFDETYYVGDAWGILRHGVEINHARNADALLAGGRTTNILAPGGEFIMHPPVGKVLIAIGEWLFGLTPFGWRFSVAVLGSLAILMTARIARRMTRSTLLGCAAGLLLALDGLEFVLSRTALLDITVMFWLLAAFGCLVVDRDRTRARFAAGLWPGTRWWRLLAGLCLGLACASKWSGVWYLPAYAALTLAWDTGARKAAGSRAGAGAVLRDSGGLLGAFAVLPAVTYLASWTGWFASSHGYDRHWAAQHGNRTPVWAALDSLYQYHRAILHYGVTLTTPHRYQSWPWTWLVMSRPVAFFYNSASHACGVRNCSQEVLAIGTPAIWWASIPALAFCVVWWVTRRDWRAGAVLAGVAAGWLPWFWYAWHDHRTMFYSYAVVFDPFLVIAITLCLGLIIGPASARVARRAAGAGAAGAYLIAVLANFSYLYPVLAAKIIPYTSWLSRMWYHGWI